MALVMYAASPASKKCSDYCQVDGLWSFGFALGIEPVGSRQIVSPFGLIHEEPDPCGNAHILFVLNLCKIDLFRKGINPDLLKIGGAL